MKKRLILLTDYRGHFYSSVRHRDASVNIPLLRTSFEGYGYELTAKQFSEIDFRNQNYRDEYVLYQSSEDRHLFYKSYIEDILLGLLLQGAILIPDFFCFRAHHNKVFMEILRDLNSNPRIKNVHSAAFGTFEDFLKKSHSFRFPIVLKPSEGCMSRNVRLFDDMVRAAPYVKGLTRSWHVVDAFVDLAKSLVRKPYDRFSKHRKKIVIQNYVSGVDHDFKVLVYWDKYYVLLRRNRPKDFRASGSGLFEFAKDLPEGLLDFALSVFKSFASPYLSMDIGYSGKDFFLLEFQFISFGTYTLEKSPHYFLRKDETWVCKRESSILEHEIANSVNHYIHQLVTKGKATF